MSLCQRCFKTPPIYDCALCKGYYCISCDAYIHSFPTKKNHTRKMIDYAETLIKDNNMETSPETFMMSLNKEDPNNLYREKDYDINNNIIKETLPIYDSNIGKTNNIFVSSDLKYEEGPYIDIDEKYLKGSTNIASKIEELSSNISTTKINLNERIDILHEHIHRADEAHKDDIININSKNLKEINTILHIKDGEIKHLQEIIEKQKAKINELKNTNKNLEINLDNCKRIKDRCLSEKEEIFYEKKKLENFYIKDLDDMQFAQEEEKKKIINGYEDKFTKTNNDYHEDKEKLLNDLRNIQLKYDQLREEHEKNIDTLNMNKNRLEQENKKREIENEQLIKDGENMKNSLKRTKTKIIEYEEEMKKFDLDNLQSAKEMEGISSKSNQIKRANTALGRSLFRSAYRPES